MRLSNSRSIIRNTFLEHFCCDMLWDFNLINVLSRPLLVFNCPVQGLLGLAVAVVGVLFLNSSIQECSLMIKASCLRFVEFLSHGLNPVHNRGPINEHITLCLLGKLAICTSSHRWHRLLHCSLGLPHQDRVILRFEKHFLLNVYCDSSSGKAICLTLWSEVFADVLSPVYAHLTSLM